MYPTSIRGVAWGVSNTIQNAASTVGTIVVSQLLSYSYELAIGVFAGVMLVATVAGPFLRYETKDRRTYTRVEQS